MLESAASSALAPEKSGEIAARLRTFICETFAPARDGITDEESLLDGGIVDSMGILELVEFIEREFEVELADEDLIADSFESVAALTRLITSRHA